MLRHVGVVVLKNIQIFLDCSMCIAFSQVPADSHHPSPNITYANWDSDLPSSFQVTCALSVEFGISSISSQRMTAVHPWCVGGCQPLSSPGILQTGQTCGCCFARSFSVFGCRLYAETQTTSLFPHQGSALKVLNPILHSEYINREGSVGQREVTKKKRGAEEEGERFAKKKCELIHRHEKEQEVQTRAVSHIRASVSSGHEDGSWITFSPSAFFFPSV